MLKYFIAMMLLTNIAFSDENNCVSETHCVKEIFHEYHSYLLFDDKYLIHNPDCRKCASKPKVIWQPNSVEQPLIMMDLDISPYRKNYFPDLYYWMED
jgi:hypothetical protein